MNQKKSIEVPLSEGTVYLRCSTFRSVLEQAVEDKLLSDNPMRHLPKAYQLHRPESTRCFLTKNELKKMMDADCPYVQLKEAFLFSCFTGLRRGDIIALRWSCIRHEGSRWTLTTRMKKTGKMITLPLSEGARRFLPMRMKDGEEAVFSQLKTSSLPKNIKIWAKSCGITNKTVTFHVARHTFATLELSLGTDIYTVSKLLGHKNVTTTQTYAKVLDKSKVKAVQLLDKVFLDSIQQCHGVTTSSQSDT